MEKVLEQASLHLYTRSATGYVVPSGVTPRRPEEAGGGREGGEGQRGGGGQPCAGLSGEDKTPLLVWGMYIVYKYKCEGN